MFDTSTKYAIALAPASPGLVNLPRSTLSSLFKYSPAVPP